MAKKLTTEEFINRGKIIHKDKFDYRHVNYKNNTTKVTIICPLHGEFEQVPTAHLSGNDCKKCRGEKLSIKFSLGISEFINRSLIIHNHFYNYDKVNYKNANKAVIITCPLHGDFLQKPAKHLIGRGCEDCSRDKQKDNPIGWRYSKWIEFAAVSPRFESFKVYILECWNENERFFKIGKTFMTIKERFEKSPIPYKWKVIEVFNGDGKYISELENRLKKDNKKFKYLPSITFSGIQECFSNIAY